MWMVKQHTFALRLLYEGDYRECIRFNNGSSNQHHSLRSPSDLNEQIPKLNVLAWCYSRSSISFVHKSVVSKNKLHGRKASLSVAGIRGSQDAKTETVTIAVAAH